MPTEPVTCASCSHKFSPKFARCPFCNVARAETAPERCAECGRERAAVLTACPFCHPEAVALSRPPPSRPTKDPQAAVADAMMRAFDVAPPRAEPMLDRRHVLLSACATAGSLLCALLCAYHYDRIGPDIVGQMARRLALVPLVFIGAWLRWTWRSSPLGFERMRATLLALVLIALPSGLALYTLLLLFNGWTADAPVDLQCGVGISTGSKLPIDCTVPGAGTLHGEAPTAVLSDRGLSSRWFSIPARRGGIGTWLIDYGAARPYDAEPRPTVPTRPVLDPMHPGARIVDDESGRSRWVPDKGDDGR